jgi:hypothetical protein
MRAWFHVAVEVELPDGTDPDGSFHVLLNIDEDVSLIRETSTGEERIDGKVIRINTVEPPEVSRVLTTTPEG